MHVLSCWLILIGDAFHNFVDGVVIAAAVLTAFPLGVTAVLAVIKIRWALLIHPFSSLMAPEGRRDGIEERRLLARDTTPQAEQPGETTRRLCHVVARLHDPRDAVLPLPRREDREPALDDFRCRVEERVRRTLPEPCE
jgi:hypothetical protein